MAPPCRDLLGEVFSGYNPGSKEHSLHWGAPHHPLPRECSARREGAEIRLISTTHGGLCSHQGPSASLLPPACWTLLSFWEKNWLLNHHPFISLLWMEQTARSQGFCCFYGYLLCMWLWASLSFCFFNLVMPSSSSVKMRIIIVSTPYGSLWRLNEVIDVKCL